MKRLLVMSLISIALIAGITLWAGKILGEVESRDRELDETFAERASALRALDAKFKPPGKKQLDPKRFEAFLRVRADVAEAMRARFAEKSKSAFHARETRNTVLERLHARLTEESMGLAEYRAIETRFQALLARGGAKTLRDKWNEETSSGQPPEPLGLPAPAADATPAEEELLQRHAKALADSMTAALLTPLLAEIAAGED